MSLVISALGSCGLGFLCFYLAAMFSRYTLFILYLNFRRFLESDFN